MGGFALWVDQSGLLHHSYSMMGVEQYKQVSAEPIPTGMSWSVCSSTPTGRNRRRA